jgi:hypothetical protein
MENKPVKQEECAELKNIMYKTMLTKGELIKETKVSTNLSNIEQFLENEKNNNRNEPWSKLDKTTKTKKLLEYIEIYKKDKNMDEEEIKNLHLFFVNCLDKKKLIRVKDVIYDKTKGIIKEIPALLYNKLTKHYTLKNMDKRVNTLKNLPPQKKDKDVSAKEHTPQKN